MTLRLTLAHDGLAHLLLHGGVPAAGVNVSGARSGRSPSYDLVTFSTGGTRYQFVTVNRDGLTRYARRYEADDDRWIGDTRISATGSDWRSRERYALTDADAALAPEDEVTDRGGLPGEPARASRPGSRRPSGREPDYPEDRPERNDFLDRVEEATRVRLGERAIIVKRNDANYLRVTVARDGGAMEQWPIGVIDGKPEEATVDAFADGVHDTFAAADPSLESELVCNAPAAPPDLVDRARRRGIRLRNFTEYQGLVDLGPLAEQQRDRLARDRQYAERLYIEQRYRIVAGGDGEVQAGLVDRAVGWMGAREARLVVVLGDFGRGKTSFLRQLTRVLPARLPRVTPVLIELRELEKAPGLDELLAQHLVQRGVEEFSLPGLRYMIESGRVALLFDGFDELELRVGYEHAAEYLGTLLGSVKGQAKVILTSRTQHFRSTDEVRTALGHRVESRTGARVVILEEFSDEQIEEFLTRLYDGDADRARARLELISGIGNLLNLAHNPRMLTFIADLDEERLRAAQDDETGEVSAAGLYAEIIDFWLEQETERQRHQHGLRGITKQERFDACTALALRLWRSKDPKIALADLSAEVTATLSDLAERGYTEEQAAHSIASGSLLIRTDDGAFTFIHQSIMEWLVAAHAARELTENETAPTLRTGQMSRLMATFFGSLADPTALDRWVAKTLSDRKAPTIAKDNALVVDNALPATSRVTGVSFDADAATGSIAQVDTTHPAAPAPAHQASPTPARQNMVWAHLGNQDLRGRDLNGAILRGANLSGANLSGMRLDNVDFTGADLTNADFTGVTMTGGSLEDAILAGSSWTRAAILGTDGLDTLTAAPELSAAALPGRDPADPMFLPSGRSESIAYSPDGTLLAVAQGTTVQLADAETGTTLRVLRGHAGQVTALAYAPDGAHIATGTADGTTRIWNTTTGTTTTTLTGHTNSVLAVAYSPDGTHIATASDDHTARIWDLREARQSRVNRVLRRPVALASKRTLLGHEAPVGALAYHPAGTWLATASADGTARIWYVADGSQRAVLTGHDAPVHAVAFSPDGAFLATASDDGTARIWDPDSATTLATLLPLPEGGYATLLPDGSYKLKGDPGDHLWWAMKLCRFAPGELDPYIPGLRKLDENAPIIGR